MNQSPFQLCNTHNEAFLKMKANMSATSTYIKPQDIHCASNLKLIQIGPTILQPDKTTLKVNQTC